MKPDKIWEHARASFQIITKIFSAVITKNRNVAYELTIKFVFFN